jgi:hypothetical protein
VRLAWLLWHFSPLVVSGINIFYQSLLNAFTGIKRKIRRKKDKKFFGLKKDQSFF